MKSFKGDSDIKKIYSAYKSRAKSKKIDFQLDLIFFSARCIQLCYICGKKGEPYNGVDRINNNNGYTPGNTAACCWECNRAKNNMSLIEFEKWLQKLNAKPSEEYEMRKGKMLLCEEMGTTNVAEAVLMKVKQSAPKHMREAFSNIKPVPKPIHMKDTEVMRSFWKVIDYIGWSSHYNNEIAKERLLKLQKDEPEFSVEFFKYIFDELSFTINKRTELSLKTNTPIFTDPKLFYRSDDYLFQDLPSHIIGMGKEITDSYIFEGKPIDFKPIENLAYMFQEEDID